MVDYQKAIEILAEVKKVVYGESGVYEAFDTSISAMQELQEYKEYGTPNGYKSALEAYDKCYSEKEIIDTELYKYQQIGTLEEVREAVEKQKKKKPIEDRHHGIRYTEVYRCHSCNESFSGRGFAKYCYHCGQAIDWGDGD